MDGKRTAALRRPRARTDCGGDRCDDRRADRRRPRARTGGAPSNSPPRTPRCGSMRRSPPSRPSATRDQSTGGPVATQQTGVEEWFGQPIAARWAVYTRPDHARVRLVTHIELAILAVGLIALLAPHRRPGALVPADAPRDAATGATEHQPRQCPLGERGRSRGDAPARGPRRSRRRDGSGAISSRIPERDQYEHLLLVAPTGAGKTSGVILPESAHRAGHPLARHHRPEARAAAEEHARGASALRRGERLGARLPRPDALARLQPARLRHRRRHRRSLRADVGPQYGRIQGRLLVERGAHADRRGGPAPRRHGGDHPAAHRARGPAVRHARRGRCSAALAESPVPEVRRLARGFLANMAKNERLLGSVFTELPPRFTCLNLARGARGHGHQRDRLRAARGSSPPPSTSPSTRSTAGRSPRSPPASSSTSSRPSPPSPSGCRAARCRCRCWPTSTSSARSGTSRSSPAGWRRSASAGIGCLLVVQDLAQLTKAYGAEDADTILSNATTKTLPGAGDARRRGILLEAGGNDDGL